MVDDEQQNQHSDPSGSSLFVVRLGSGEDSYAVCERMSSVPGTRRLPGSGRTVAELVSEQALQAAGLPPGDEDGVRELLFLAQSGENDLDND